MTDIHELNRRRSEAAAIMQMLGEANSPVKFEDQVKADARYRLAADAHARAESEYSAAIANMTTQQLTELVKEHPSATPDAD